MLKIFAFLRLYFITKMILFENNKKPLFAFYIMNVTEQSNIKVY